MAVTDWRDAKSRFRRFVSVGGTARSLDQNGIETVCLQKNPSMTVNT